MIEIDLSKCTLTEMLDMVSGTMSPTGIIQVIKRIVVNADALTGADIGMVMSTIATRLQESMNPK